MFFIGSLQSQYERNSIANQNLHVSLSFGKIIIDSAVLVQINVFMSTCIYKI